MRDAAFLEGEDGIRLRVIPFGARLTHLWAPDRNGDLADIVLGPPEDALYHTMPGYLGATCGRFTGRIDRGQFELDGTTYQLELNDGQNTLHGGPSGFDRKVWDMETAPGEVRFSSSSASGEMGFPGACQMEVQYRIEGRRVTIEMSAECDAPTPVNIVNHAYFNLGGHGTVHEHHLALYAAHYLPSRKDLLPTGDILPVAGTLYDFSDLTDLGVRLNAYGGKGYDCNWCIDGEGLRAAARVTHPPSGRSVRLTTNQPGVQVYTTGYATPDMIGKDGTPIPPLGGLTLETQGYPNAPNEPAFPNTILRPGERFNNAMILDLSADG
ncbi:MAG: galactose mutarotase [Rhodobacteraceae bacterium]|nr:galactose mutarotase [Paracoccaceae bacterium]